MDREQLLKKFIYKDGLLFRVFKDNKTKLVSSKNSSGYLRVSYEQNFYLVHRLIYFIHYGYFPKIVDHIDGNILIVNKTE